MYHAHIIIYGTIIIQILSVAACGKGRHYSGYTGARHIDAGASDQLQTRLESSGVAVDLINSVSLLYKNREFTVQQNADITR